MNIKPHRGTSQTGWPDEENPSTVSCADMTQKAIAKANTTRGRSTRSIPRKAMSR